eukprot:sb/3478592/
MCIWTSDIALYKSVQMGTCEEISTPTLTGSAVGKWKTQAKIALTWVLKTQAKIALTWVLDLKFCCEVELDMIYLIAKFQVSISSGGGAMNVGNFTKPK